MKDTIEPIDPQAMVALYKNLEDVGFSLHAVGLDKNNYYTMAVLAFRDRHIQIPNVPGTKHREWCVWWHQARSLGGTNPYGVLWSGNYVMDDFDRAQSVFAERIGLKRETP